MKDQAEIGTASVPTLPSRSQRVRLLIAALAALAALALLCVRILNAPKSSNLLQLSGEVQLYTPPAPITEDSSDLRSRLSAVDPFEKAALADPHNASAHIEWGRQAINAGDPLTARFAFQSALRISPPQDPAVYDALGTCCAQLGLFTEATDAYTRLVTASPEEAAGYLGLSKAYAALGLRDKAQQALESASKQLRPSDVRGRLDIAAAFDARFQSTRAMEEARMAQKAAPADGGVAVSVAGLLIKLRKVDEAVPLLKSVLSHSPGDRLANRLLGQIENDPAGKKRNVELAEHYFLTALRSDAHDTKACEELAQMYLDQRRYKQAAYVSTLWLEAAPNSGAARMSLANAYAGLNQPEESRTQRAIAERMLTWERSVSALALQRDRTPVAVQPRIALARKYVEGGRLADALIEAQAAVCLAPHSPQSLDTLRSVYQRIGLDLPDSRVLPPSADVR